MYAHILGKGKVLLTNLYYGRARLMYHYFCSLISSHIQLRYHYHAARIIYHIRHSCEQIQMIIHFMSLNDCHRKHVGTRMEQYLWHRGTISGSWHHWRHEEDEEGRMDSRKHVRRCQSVSLNQFHRPSLGFKQTWQFQTLMSEIHQINQIKLS